MKTTNTLAKLTLFSASLIFSLQATAAAIDPEGQPLGYIGPMELSDTDLTDGAKGYRGWFENGAWQGDLVEYNVSSTGGISTSINLGGPSPVQTDGGSNWSAHVRFADTAATTSHWNSASGRKIIFSNNNGQNQKAFRWNELNIYQKAALDNLTGLGNTSPTASPVLNYIRGDRSNEGGTGSMRTRYTVLGDIIHSNPEYVGAPEGTYTDSEYVTFKNDNASRSPRVYVGANDGMLHSFNAINGKEMWAYVPSMLIPKMSSLVDKPYAHTYFVDGGITIKDAYVDGKWQTVLVGSLGAGGRGLYALNVTNPWLGSEAATAGTAQKIMWEERAENTPGDPAGGANPDIGYIFDASSIVQMNDGKWYAVFGNGIGSDNGIAMLMAKELRTLWTSNPTVPISTGSGSDNGLAAPALVDTNNDGMVDVAWAGDINGDLWRFDLSGGPGNWKKAYKVYDGSPSQPITTAPDIANHPQYGHIVMFGTGKLYEDADIDTTDTQALYGIWDPGTQPTNTAVLDQILSYNTSYNRFGYSEKVRTFTTTIAVDYAVYGGWRVEFYPAERMLTPPQLRAGRLKATIYNPDGGTNWLLEATFLDGFMADNSIYNLNQDAKLDELDRVNGNGNNDPDGNPDYTDPEDIPMSWQRPDGNMSQPTIASLAQGIDTMFLNFLDPPVVETAITGDPGCVGNCAGGLEGGHIDLDWDKNLDGNTNEHDHQYDDKANSTIIDYLDLKVQTDMPIVVGGLGNGRNKDTRFIPLIANADFSKGATLKISRTGSTNDLEYNVVEYQKLIHQALANWDGVSDLEDPNRPGESLIYTVNTIDEFKIIFNSLAIITGGLHPSETGCVQSSASHDSYNGRWRNGSLTMHFVEADLFSSPALGVGEQPLDRLKVQTPADFQEAVYMNGKGVALTDPGIDGIVTGTAPDYEIYGGLHADPARASNGFMYESTMFWHFDGDCYGKPNWAADYYRESQNSVIEIFLERLDRTEATNLEELAALIDGLIADGCATAGGGDSGDKDKDTKDKTPETTTTPDPGDASGISCQAEYDELVDLYALGLLIEANGTAIQCGADGCLGDGSTEDTGGSGTTNADKPQSIIGGVDEGGITSGPNFEAGRRTWIDILVE